MGAETPGRKNWWIEDSSIKKNRASNRVEQKNEELVSRPALRICLKKGEDQKEPSSTPDCWSLQGNCKAAVCKQF